MSKGTTNASGTPSFLFRGLGANTAAPNASATPTASVFGTVSGASNTGAAANPFSFGGNTQSSAPSIFGSSKPVASLDVSAKPAALPFGAASGSAFGQKNGSSVLGSFGASNSASDSAAPPPAGSLFGAATPASAGSDTAKSATSGVFGAKPESAEPEKKSETAAPQFSFGKQASSGSESSDSTVKPSLFGHKDAAAAPAPSLFGANPAENTSSSLGLFGAKSADKCSTITGLFGSKPEASGGLFGAANEGTSDKPAGGLFGAKTDTASTAGVIFGKTADATPVSTGGLFGAKTEAPKPASLLFSLGKTEPAKEGLAPFFGNKKETTTDNATPSFSFGKSAESKGDTAAAPSFSFGKPAETKPSTEKTPAPSFSFGAKPAEAAKPAETTAKADALAAAPATGISSTPSTAPKTDQKDKDKLAAKNQPNLKPTQAKPIAVSLDNKTLDDLIMSWSKKLTQTESIFSEYTEKVREWDEKLANTGQDIMDLHRDSVKVEGLQQRIDQQLLFVEIQQAELDKILDNYEQQADILLANIDSNGFENSIVPAGNRSSAGASNLYATDDLREKAYYNAEVIDDKLSLLGDNLLSLIESINSVSGAFNKELLKGIKTEEGDSGSPSFVEGTVKLINLHLDSLKYIESKKNELEAKVKLLNGS
ncbi:hypothetical protein METBISCDRAFT_13724 [Metschnikowia bicuspidata]|uniref:Nucleoporin NSP1-like C-terminal domain-containing protein n=1 Tax=Metschnikowia bicuspidata TaxID=27322 RepID=A0A4P9ZI00_9ASCO|nr:hypothetical protein METBISCDRAFT_13724 [Metschnikowia bicuspidata]